MYTEDQVRAAASFVDHTLDLYRASLVGNSQVESMVRGNLFTYLDFAADVAAVPAEDRERFKEEVKAKLKHK